MTPFSHSTLKDASGGQREGVASPVASQSLRDGRLPIENLSIGILPPKAYRLKPAPGDRMERSGIVKGNNFHFDDRNDITV
jgi:hypothetical protein